MSTEMITSAEIRQELRGMNRPFFAKWIWDAKNRGYLDLFIEGLLHANQIVRPIEVINHLAKVLPDEVLQNTKKVNLTDFLNSSSNRVLFKDLVEEITKERPSSVVMDKTNRYGVYGHSMAANLFSGELIPSEVFINGGKETPQMTIFANEYDYQLLSQYKKHSKKTVQKKVLRKLVDKIQLEKDALLKIWHQGHLPVQSPQYRELLKDLLLIFKNHLEKILEQDILDDENQYLSFLTVMTWVEVLLYYKRVGSFPLFSEVFVLENSSDVGVGRLDVLSVVSINGLPPNKDQCRRIQLLTKRTFPSVGHIIMALINQFGAHLHLKITDWKFAVGDGINRMKKQVNVIYKDDVEMKPFKKHSDQLERYLSLSVLSHSLATGTSKLEEIEKLWETNSFSLTGELVYFFPDRTPVVHKIELTKEEIQSVFKDQIVSNFQSAKLRATMRVSTNLIMRYVLELCREKSQKQVVNNTTRIEFPEEDLYQKVPLTISAIIREFHHPIFKDPPTNTIEIVGYRKNGTEENLEMHIDRVFECIASGAIRAEPGFNKRTGGKICCPVHGESTPSLSLAFDIGRFTCFGCPVRGTFNIGSIPEGVDITIGKSTHWELDSLVIPPRHREVMTIAQDILYKSFPGSPGEAYLAITRGLNPYISYRFMDAGYGDQRLIKGLLDAGITLNELVYYGILGVSKSKYAAQNSTVATLKQFGYTLDTMKQLTDDSETYGLPYSILEGRVTYPLEIFKVINSIYGRSIDLNCPKNLRHRKTKSKASGMKHGGINLTWAVESNAPYLMLSEAGLNADTWLEMANDVKNQTAIVGVNNLLLVEFLAKSKKDIILAYDFDLPKWNEKLQRWEGETGQRNTVLTRDRLLEYGFKGHVYDFTGGFVKRHPEVSYNDANQYWLDYNKKINVLDYIQEIPEVYVNSMEKK